MRECDSDTLIYHFYSSNSKALIDKVELQKREVSKWTSFFACESVFWFLWAVRCCSKPLSLQDTRLRRITQSSKPHWLSLWNRILYTHWGRRYVSSGMLQAQFLLLLMFSWQKCFQRWALQLRGTAVEKGTVARNWFTQKSEMIG